MKSDRQPNDDLRDLLWAIEDGTISADGLARVDQLVQGDTASLHQYIEYMRLVSDLKFGLNDGRISEVLQNLFDAHGEQTMREDGVGTMMPPTSSPPVPSIIIHPVPEMQASPFSLSSPLGGMMFSYAASALLVCLGMLIGWTWKVSDAQLLAKANERMSTQPSSPAPSPAPKMAFVARISGLVNCTFSSDKDILPPPSRKAFVPLGRKYKLDSGLMEITYNTGAKVILQGPMTYEVDSASGGFLSDGKLTASVESAKPQAASIVNNHSKSPNPLFFIRTPTAVITDLGTEFGVECDKSGLTRSHVFRGSVRVQQNASDGSAESQGVVLGENESATVETGPNRSILVTREVAAEKAPSSGFTRRMPRRAPIKLFNTGIGLQEGQADPHWECIARSDEPNFKPRPAVVVEVFSGVWLANDPQRSQWISESRSAALPHGVTHTFRTTFELSGLTSQSAVVRGRFVADNFVKAIRLNGKNVPLPRYSEENPFDQFSQMNEFLVRQGFVEGSNSLEIDVFNGKPEVPNSVSPMGLRIELEGFYYSRNPLPEAAKENRVQRR